MQWHRLPPSCADKHVLFMSHWKPGRRADGDLSEPQLFRVITALQQILQQNKRHVFCPAISSAWFIIAYVNRNIWIIKIADYWIF